jgi:phospholipase C
MVPDAALASRRRARLWARPDLLTPRLDQLEAMRALGRRSLRMPDSLPNAALAAGTDTMPEIEHIVVLMMENHSFDNFLGMLGRGAGQVPRGDGLTIAADGYPANSNPQSNGAPLRSFHMPTTCQFSAAPTQEWEQAHIQYAGGKNSGFVVSGSGDVAMGYFDATDLPFTYDLATHFPIGDRYFCSVLGQTDPNRRFLFAGTSMGMTDDIPDPSQDAAFGLSPPNGTIFTQLTNHGISWYEYASDLTTGGESGNLYFADDYPLLETHAKPYSQFLTDAAAGNLPSFSFIDPNYSTQSQENPQNIVVGEAFLRSAVEAVLNSPKWQQTILIINYDEHGGYYDHVPPPVALAPDDIQPVVPSGESTYDGFKRYGFRVPCIVVSPYAKQNYVSHMVYDHTSVLAFVERKFNLPAMTLRDANANDMTDFLDLSAMAAGKPTFPELPSLVASGDTGKTLACSTSGPGTVPPPAPPAIPLKVALQYAGPDRKLRGLALDLWTTRSVLTGLTVQLRSGSKKLTSVRVAQLTTEPHQVVLRVHGKLPPKGHYTIAVTKGAHTLAEHHVKLG